MVKINGVRLTGVSDELADRVRSYGESDVLWAWVVARDGEPAVLATTQSGLRIVTLGGEQWISWDQLDGAESLGPNVAYLKSSSGGSVAVRFRSSYDCRQFLHVVLEPEAAEEVPQEEATVSPAADPVHESLLRIEAQLARIVDLLEARGG